MAYDKVVDASKLDENLTSVADAIRTKSGTTGKLTFPDGFVSAVEEIQTESSPIIQPLSITENGTYEAPDGVDGYSPVTVAIESGGGGDEDVWNPPEEYTCFYDYDGTILYQYTVEETQALTELPPLPADVNHEGLVFEGWNWSLEDLKALDYPMDVGALYNTYDGKGRLYITLASEDELTVTLNLYQTTSGAASVDFGDGSDTEVLSGTNAVSVSHTFPAVGDYVVAIENTNPSAKVRFGKHNYKGTVSVFDNKTILTKVEIGNIYPSASCFYANTKLKAIANSRETYSMSGYGCYGCTNLFYYTATDLDPSIGLSAFAESGLKAISTSNGWASSDNTQFKQCTSLRRVCFGSSVKKLNGGTFEKCNNLERVFWSDGLSTLGNNEFFGCSKLNWVNLPSALTAIPIGCFYNCKSLKNIKFNSAITSINNNAFYGCALLSIKIPTTLTEIGASAFYNCYRIRMTDVPSGVMSLSENVFDSCHGIKEVTFKSKPSIDSNAFANCVCLDKINVPWDESEVANAPWGAIYATINYNYTGG